MKYLLVLIIALASFTACLQEKSDSFSIAAIVENGNDKLVKISAREDGKWIDLDTAIVSDGAFNLSSTVTEPQMLYLRIMDEGGFRYVPIFSDNKNKITIDGDLNLEDDMVINGSELTDLYKAYESGLEKETAPLKELFEMLELTDDENNKDSLELIIDKIDKSSNEYILKFIMDHASSPVAGYAAMRGYSYGKEYEDLKPIVDALSSYNASSKYVISLTEKLEKLKVLAVGLKAPSFIQTDVDGEEFDISSLKGKYVLIDFWASWCKPCRKENPNVVALYNELEGQDFEILGVSLDKDEEKWKKAIEDDGLTWEHVSDLQAWKNEVAQLYSVSAIPQTYLLDKEGIIVAKNLTGSKLRDKVKELLSAES